MSQSKSLNSYQKRLRKETLFRGRTTAPCCFCRRRLVFHNATLEHVTPLSEGGSWKIENLRLSCEKCNQRRGITPFDVFRDSVRRVGLRT